MLQASTHRATVTALLLGSGIAGAAWAVEVPELPAQPSAPSAPLTLPPTSDLPRLLDLVALRLKVQIDYDPVNPQLKGQQVTLRSGGAEPGAVTDQELWAITSRLLVQRGLTTVRAPGSSSLTVVKLEDAPRLARLEMAITPDGKDASLSPSPTPSVPVPGAVAPPKVEAGFRNQPVRMRHVSLKEANESLRAMGRSGPPGGGSNAGSVSAAVSSGDLVLLSDTSPRIEEQLIILRQLDTPDNATVVQAAAVSNVAPVQLAATVAQLATKRESVSGEKLPGEVVAGSAGGVLIIAPRRVIERWQQLVTLADQREPVATQTYTPRLFSVKEVGSLIQQIAAAGGGSSSSAGTGDDRFKVIIEEPTGSLIVTATPTQHEKIAALMQRLDAVPGESRRPVRSFIVRNRPVTEFAATLQRLISAGVLEGNLDPAAGSSPSSGTPSGMAQTTPNTPLPPGVSPLSPFPASPTPASRPSSTPRTATGVQPLAITLAADEPTNTIIAVGDGRLLDQLDALIKTLDVRQPQVMLEAVLVSLADEDTINLGVELEQLSRSGATTARLASLFGLMPANAAGPALFGADGPPGGTALVIDPGDYSVIINALQKVKKGRTVSRPKVLVANNQQAVFNSVRQEPFAASFTAGNASSPTTTFGGSQDAGTQLTIRPQIGDGGGLLLDYNLSISQFAGSAASANLPPPRQVTSVQSLATIPDGYTVVVGGLEAFSEGDNADQVPLLSQIPLIGELFKNQVKSKTKSKFFVFIHASVMRDQSLEALRYTSEVDTSTAGVPTNWPKSTPQVVR